MFLLSTPDYKLLQTRDQVSYLEVKNSVGNGEGKELIWTTHGHELREGGCWIVGDYRAEEDKGEKKLGHL